jgi:excisionase family DNA binding protein
MKVSAREAAQTLGLSERTVRRWISSGALPADRVGRSFAIEVETAREVSQQSSRGKSLREGAELAELRGRYLEALRQIERLEQALTAERRRVWELEGGIAA